jgi:cytoskeletal protein CcmA (bactofilin family)
MEKTMQDHNRKNLLAGAGFAFALACAALALLLLVACGASSSPSTPQPLATAGATNFLDLELAGDLTVADDVTFGDDVSVGGNISMVDGVWNGIIEGNVIFGDDSDATIMWETDAVNGDALLLYSTAGHIRAGTVATKSLEISVGNLAVGDGTPDTTLDGEDAYIEGTLEVDGAVNLDGIVNVITDTEHIGTITIDAVAIDKDTDGALWTAGATEIWFIHALYCHVTTNFDCDGDDCAIDIGDGNDADGFLDLIDGELQTTDTEGTGAPAGWQGFMGTSTRGVYLAEGLGFVYTNDTIDIVVEEVSGGDPDAGAATCYLVYTRIQ